MHRLVKLCQQVEWH